MGLEYITQPQVFLQPISALGGIAGFVTQPEFEFPPVTSFYTWTTSTGATANTFFLDGAVTLLNQPGSFIISVGGVVQSPLTYTVNSNARLVTFDSAVPSGVEITVTQIGTVALTANSFAAITASDIFNTNLVNTNLTSVNAVIETLNVLQTATFAGIISGNNLRTSFNQGSATGNYSFAEGSGKAFGNYSHAEGRDTIASGNYSHAEGRDTIASGDYSHAEGQLTKASIAQAHAEGWETTASGQASHAEGTGTIASGQNSHAEGYYTIAFGGNSHAAGIRATAAQDYTYAWSDADLGTLTENVSTTRTGQYMVSASGGVFIPGNLGIGTDSNANALTVRGSISATGDALIFGRVVANNLPSNFILNANRAPLTVTSSVAYFDSSVALTLSSNKAYEIFYDLYFSSATSTSLRYVLSANRNFTNVVCNYIASQSGAGGVTTAGNAQIGGALNTTSVINLPPFTVTAGVSSYSRIKALVETLDTTTFLLAVSGNLAGTVTPLRGSKRTVTLLN